MSQSKKADLHSVYIRRSMYALKLVVSLSCPSRLSDRTISRPENPLGLQGNIMILERDMQPKTYVAGLSLFLAYQFLQYKDAPHP